MEVLIVGLFSVAGWGLSINVKFFRDFLEIFKLLRSLKVFGNSYSYLFDDNYLVPFHLW